MNAVKIEIYNSITGIAIGEIYMPFSFKKAMKGFYSRYWRELRTSFSNNARLPKSKIRAKITRIPNVKGEQAKTATIKLPSGVELSFPEDVTEYDCKIILAQLEVLKMPFNKPRL